MAIGYLTPDSVPATTVCRVLLIPDDVAWMAIVTGALSALITPDAWQKYGTLSPEECADRMLQMLDEFTFNGECPP